MKPVIACLLLLLCAATVGQAQTITTQFTLGNATANCIPVTTQDGVPVAAGAGAVCPQGFFGGGSMQVALPKDPAFPGQSLTMYICSASLVSSTIPPVSSTQQAPGSYVQALSCQANYGYYTAQWDGTLTYNYNSVRQRRCSSGRGGYCRTAYYPVMSGGSGILSTPLPPPPPPQPPPPTVVNVNILGGFCDGSLVCTLIPATTDVLTSAVLDVYGYTLTVTNADGSVSTSPLDVSQVYAIDDDGTTYGVNASGTLYNANGDVAQGVAVVLVLSIDEAGKVTVASGTVEITY
jgi:hypothetical protein